MAAERLQKGMGEVRRTDRERVFEGCAGGDSEAQRYTRARRARALAVRCVMIGSRVCAKDQCESAALPAPESAVSLWVCTHNGGFALYMRYVSRPNSELSVSSV